MTLRDAAARLAAVSDTPRLDAELLMAHALGVSREAMLFGDYETPPAFEDLLARRLAHEPVAYITGTRDFWTISLEVTPDVLIPRPDSETLIEAAVEYFGAAGPKTVLDLGTGSGALLLAALAQWPDSTGIGVDASIEAIQVARRNVRRLDMVGRANIRHGGWTYGGTADLVLCNPPYIALTDKLPRDVTEYEPHQALFSGADGLDDYRMLAPVIAEHLDPGGMIAVEIGATQAEAVSALFRNAGLSPQLRRDLAGRPRAIVHLGLGKALRSS